MKNPTMLYKFPGNQAVVAKEGYATKVVDTDEVEAALEEGWCCSPQEAKELEEAKPTTPSEAPIPPPQKAPAFAQGDKGKKVPQGDKGK